MTTISCASPLASHRFRVVLGSLLAALALSGARYAFAGGESSTPIATFTGESSPNFHLSLGVGDTSIGPVAIASLSFDMAHFLFRARASRTTSFNLEGPPAVAITDLSALVGAVVRGGPVRFHAAMGVGVGYTTRRGPRIPPGEGSSPFSLAPAKYEWVRYDKIVNLPVQLGVSLDSEHSGIGLDVVANVNREVSTFGVALTVSGGRMR
jgi:hypothetical protein